MAELATAEKEIVGAKFKMYLLSDADEKRGGLIRDSTHWTPLQEVQTNTLKVDTTYCGPCRGTNSFE